MTVRGSFNISNISREDGLLILVFVALGIVFGATIFRQTITLQPIIQEKIVEVRMITGDNLIVLNGTNLIPYEDGKLTIEYYPNHKNSDQFRASFVDNNGKQIWYFYSIWTDWYPYSEGFEIRFEIPDRGKYVSSEVTGTHIIFRRVK